MSVKSTLARIAHPIEKAVSRVFPNRAVANPILSPYGGFASPDALHLQGRILSPVARKKPTDGQAVWLNMWQMLRLFMTDEVADVRINAQGNTTTSDEEGYVRLAIPRDQLRAGWHDVQVTLPDHPGLTARMSARVPSPDAQFGVISDVDDTLMQTGAYTLWKNLWTTFTGNIWTRKIFPDAVTFMQRVQPDVNPVFYVSSSPWNLYEFLTTIFARNNLPRAPMFLRDLGISETQFITGTHGDHKGAAIDTILAANPDLPFILVGDTGQHDAHVYLDAAKRHPERIVKVVLREPGPGPDAKSRHAMDELRALGVEVESGKTFDGIDMLGQAR